MATAADGFGRILDLLFPPRCVGAGCGRAGDWLCSRCLARVSRIAHGCPRCAAPLAGPCTDCRRLGPWPFEGVAAAGLYGGPIRDAIRALKFGGLAALGEPLGGLAARAAADRWDRSRPLADVVVPVPGDEARIRRRGVDHAAEIARSVGRFSGVPYAPELLRRTREVPRQVGLMATERAMNLHGAFAPSAPVSGIVLLVDDVLTTGATARAAAEVLVGVGATVRVAVVARADRR